MRSRLNVVVVPAIHYPGFKRFVRFLDQQTTTCVVVALAVAVAVAVAVSDRTLLRRFGAAIGQTPLGYLQAVRLEAARALLEAGDTTVQAVAAQDGYSDASSFSRLCALDSRMVPLPVQSRTPLNEIRS